MEIEIDIEIDIDIEVEVEIEIEIGIEIEIEIEIEVGRGVAIVGRFLPIFADFFGNHAVTSRHCKPSEVKELNFVFKTICGCTISYLLISANKFTIRCRPTSKQ